MTIQKEEQNVSFIVNGVRMYLGTTEVKYCKVFEPNGEELILGDKDVVLSQFILDKNQLRIGDTIAAQVGDIKKELKIKTSIKDAAFGNSLVGMSRILVSPSNFKQYIEQNSDNILGLYYVNINEQSDFAKELNLQGFKTIINTVPRDTLSGNYAKNGWGNICTKLEEGMAFVLVFW